jgi:hypothetical protein
MAYIVVFALKFAIKILPGLSIQVVVILSRPLNRLFETFELSFWAFLAVSDIFFLTQ